MKDQVTDWLKVDSIYTYDFFISRPLIGRAIGVVNLYDNWTRQLKWRIHMCILLETCLLGVLSLNLVSWVEFRPPLARDGKPRASPSASHLWPGEALNSTQLTKFSHTTPCKHVSNILYTYDSFISRALIGRAIDIVNLYENWTSDNFTYTK